MVNFLKWRLDNTRLTPKRQVEESCRRQDSLAGKLGDFTKDTMTISFLCCGYDPKKILPWERVNFSIHLGGGGRGRDRQNNTTRLRR